MLLKGVVLAEDRPESECGPHGAARIANRAIVCHVAESLVAAGAGSLAVVAGARQLPALRDAIESEMRGGVPIRYLETRGHGLWGALRAASAFVADDPCIAHPAEGLVGQDLDPFCEALGARSPELLLLLHRTGERSQWLAPSTHRALGLTELGHGRSRLALTGVCLFGPGALARTCERPSEACAGVRADLAEIACGCAGRNAGVEAALVRSWRRYTGSPCDLLELNRVALDRIAAQTEPADHGDNRIEGRVIIDGTAEVSASIIVGPSIIGPRARISSSYIGPYTAIGAGAEIENSEIARSIVAEGTRIRHIGGRIEASTIGRDATIFRDFALPRAIRLHVGEGVELALT